MNKFLYVIIILLTQLTTIAQQHKLYSIENGLPSNMIYKIIQDKEGFIWIATDKGISKFDGHTFKNFTTKQGLPTNDIWELIVDDNNRIWYFTKANSQGYIYKDKVHNFFGKNKKDVFYPKYLTDGHKVEFTSYGKHYRLIDSTWIETANLNNNKLANYQVLNNKIELLAFTDLKNKTVRLSVVDKKKDTIKDFILPRSDFMLEQQINDSLFVLRMKKNLYFLNLIDLKLHEIDEYKKMDSLKFIRFYSDIENVQISSSDFIAYLDTNYKIEKKINFSKKFNASNAYRDKKGNIWISSYNKGIYVISNSSRESKYYLENHKIKFLKKSINNTIYAGVLDKGLYTYDKQKDKFELIFPVKTYIYGVYYVDNQNFVVFGYHTTYVMKNGKLTKYYPKYLQKNAIGFKNSYYVITLNGLNKYNDELVFTKFIPLTTPKLFSIFKNRLIVANIKTLYEIKNDVPVKIEFIEKHLPYRILSFAVYKDKLLIGTDGFGVYIWDGKENLKKIEDTKELIVNSIIVNDNTIWVGAQEGVRVYFEKNNDFKFYKTIRKSDGLVSDQVIDIELFGNKLFAASYNGISKISLDKSPNIPLQNIYFKQIKYGDFDLSDNNNKVAFNNTGNLQVVFGTIDFSGQEHNDYYYKLKPIQNKWTKTLSNNIQFSQLQPNNYTLEIKVENPYGQSLTKKKNFTIIPLWWQTKWAILFFALVILTTIFLLAYFVRKKELKKQRKKLVAQKEKVEFELYALRSQMNPHFVFNSLNAIQYYINEENFEKSETYLVKFSRLIRMIFDLSRLKTIKIYDEIKLLKSYLEIEKMRFGDDFNYCINIDNDLDINKTEIPTMLLQPIIENSVNHGIFHKQGKGTICLSFEKQSEKQLIISVKDDGVGIKKSMEINRKSLKKHKSRSTQILKKRIELLNLSGKWKIKYQLFDLTSKDNPYKTVVNLTITQL